jgi:ankyrin repeat protein
MDNEIYEKSKEDPTLIFTYIRRGNYELAFELLDKNIVSINTLDSVGNDVLTKLLKAKQYEYVIQLMKKRNWNVNNQNDEGNTFGHILAMDNSPMAIKVVEELQRKSNYIPNLKNKRHETAMDIALNNNYLCTAFKLLEDKRFNEIDCSSFKNLFMTSIENKYYGKYSKINNLEIIVDSLEKKDLSEAMRNLIDCIIKNLDMIKNDIMNNRYYTIESIIDYYA